MTNVRKAAKKAVLFGAKVGMKVKGFFQNRHWHPAVITAVNEDGTCNIKYHDGVEEDNYGALRLAIVLDVDADGEEIVAQSKPAVLEPVESKPVKAKKTRKAPVLPARGRSKRTRRPTVMDGETR